MRKEGRGRREKRLDDDNIPPYKLSCSSLNMSMTSHSKTLFPTRPQLIPGISLSVCICLNWRVRMMAALLFWGAAEPAPPDGEVMMGKWVVLSRVVS